MLLCAVVLCVLLLSLNSSKAEGIPTATDARAAAKKFQNALTQQSLQTVLLSIEERLRNLDNIYAMQYSPSIEGKLEMYGRKLESVEAKISRLEAVMGNELDKISENISSRNFKDDLARDHVLRKIDSVYERMNHRMIFAEGKMELMERKLETKLDTILSRMEKMEDSLEIKDADMQTELADVLTCIEELKTQSENVEQKLNNITKTLNLNPRPIQSDETTLSLTSENITASVRRDMKENFEVLSNKMVDFHETSWQTYDRLERTLRSMSLVSNLTRYEIQNGLRSLTVEVGRLSGGQGLLSDSSKEKSKLHEIDKKIDSNFESLMLAQNLFMENCYRLQKDEPQLETKISEVLDEMIDTFNAKTSVAPKDIKKLEQAIKNHDSGMKNALKGLSTILHKSHLTDLKIEDGLNSLNTIKINLTNLHSSKCNHDEANRLYQKIEEVVQFLKTLQKGIDKIKPAMENDITNLVDTNKLQHVVDKLENLTKINSQETTLNFIKDYMEKVGKIIEDIENKTNVIGFIFTEQYKNHWQMFLDEYGKKYSNKINQINTTEASRNMFSLESDTIAAIKSKCFSENTPEGIQDSIFDCLQGILSEDERRAIKIYCLFNTTLTEEECVRSLTNIQFTGTTTTMPEQAGTMLEIIKTNCFPEVDIRSSATFSNFECLQGQLNKEEIQKIRLYCTFHGASSEEACLRNITGLDNKDEIVDKLDQNTIERIKTKCFPSLIFENGSGFDCLQGILNEDDIQNIKNYCVNNDLQSEEACLRNITKMTDHTNFVELDSNIIQIIRTNCFPAIDLRNSANSLTFECVNSIFNESIIQEIKNYCLLKEIRSEEDCLRNITTGLDDIDEGTIRAINDNCSPEIDVRNSGNFSISDCIRAVLNETTISKIRNYCSSKAMNEEDCLRQLIDLERVNSENVLAKITEEVRQTIRTNCFPEIDLRASDNASTFECLNGILSEDDVRSIKAYCSSNTLPADTCLNKIINVDNSKANITKRNEGSSNGSDNIKANSNENLLRLGTRTNFVNATAAITPETTRETDYQTTEIIEHNEYEDYSLGIY